MDREEKEYVREMWVRRQSVNELVGVCSGFYEECREIQERVRVRVRNAERGESVCVYGRAMSNEWRRKKSITRCTRAGKERSNERSVGKQKGVQVCFYIF